MRQNLSLQIVRSHLIRLSNLIQVKRRSCVELHDVLGWAHEKRDVWPRLYSALAPSVAATAA